MTQYVNARAEVLVSGQDEKKSSVMQSPSQRICVHERNVPASLTLMPPVESEDPILYAFFVSCRKFGFTM